MNATARTTTTILAGAAFALLALTGCAAGGAETPEKTPAAESQTQSTEDACTVLRTGLVDVSTALSDSAAGFTTDPEASALLVHDAAVEFDGVVADITNTDVKDAATAASADITALSEQFDLLAADPENADADAITAAGEDAKTSIEALQTVCS